MPELPEAETIARQLHRQLAGQVLGPVKLERRDVIRTPAAKLSELSGAHVVRVHRRAKRVIIDVDIPASLVVGLGMTGRLYIVPAASEIEKHTHVRISLPELDAELRFRDPRRFGGIWFYPREPDGSRPGDLLRDLGIEPLTCTASQFRALLARKRQIKALLMDQSAIAGLGNIYCDESLYAARIHPLTRSHRISGGQADILLKAIKLVLRRAIRSKGSTLLDYRDANGREGGFQRLHKVYGREGEPCLTCRAPIKRILAAGRSTHLCPRCQKKRA